MGVIQRGVALFELCFSGSGGRKVASESALCKFQTWEYGGTKSGEGRVGPHAAPSVFLFVPVQ